jgi:hypothetical protein
MFHPAQNGKPTFPKPLAGLTQNRTGPLSSLVADNSSLSLLIACDPLLEFNANH